MGEVIGYMNGKPVVCTTDVGEAMVSVVASEKLRRLGEYLRAKPKTPTPKPRTWKKRRRK